MKKLKEIRVKFIMSWAQPLADFIILRMKETDEENEFNTLFTFGLYLDFYCTKKDIYLN